MGTTGQSITLANSIIGVGILAMPFCFQQCGVVLATLILLAMGLVSRLCCYFLLKSALIAKRRNFEYLAFHVFGSTGKLAVEVGIIGFLMGTCIAYFVVVGDLGPQIIAKMLNINQSDMLRTSIMVIVSLVCVLPLGLLRNVDSLSNVSAATIGFYFCLVLKVILEATTQLSSESPTQVEMWKPAGVLQCVPIFSMALFCQTQLFEIFESMPSLSLEKMNVVTKNAINICTAVYFTLGLFGYIAFSSQNISGNILMSLSPTMASDVIKLGFVMSVAFSFPLIIFPCRASLYSFLFKKVHLFHHDHIINHSIPTGTFRCITVGIVVSALLVSLALPNIELVLGLVGSTIGVMICILFPAACFVNVTFKNTNERVLAKVIMGLGLVIMVLGTYANLQAAETKLDRYEDKFTQERIDKIVEDFFESKKIVKVNEPDVMLAPEKDLKSNIDVDNNNEKIVKDSEVQPPNPVPPDSISEEKLQIPVQEEKVPIPAIEEKIQMPVIEQINGLKEKQSENSKTQESIPIPKLFKESDVLKSQPHNLQMKQNEDQNIEAGKKPEVNVNSPKESIKSQPSEQDKIDKIKQEQLIETIKQHGREQKELIKEQKEILDEIIKTKKEMQQKKEVDSIEAKKIAVESIQKIANMAIQSISGVSEKPGDKKIIVDEKSKSLANDAVQEIAKKAVETLEAIKEEKVKKEPVPIPVVKNVELESKTIISSQNGQPNQNIQESIPNKNIKLNNEAELKKIEKINDRSDGHDIRPVINGEAEIKQDILEANSDLKQKKTLAYILEPPKLRNLEPDPNVQPLLQKEHSHLPDEPQSYKLGEDSQKVIANANLIKKDSISEGPILHVKNSNDPLLHDKSQTHIELPQSKVVNKLEESKKVPQKKSDYEKIEPIETNQKLHQRHKREAVDCTKKASLQPENKDICKTLSANPDSEEILSSKVEFGGLPNLPLYHIRSLKNFKETEKR